MQADYVDFLTEEFTRRKNRNERYSERAFARDLGLSAGFFKQILQRKKNLSGKKALAVARQLNWTEYKAERFIQAVNATKHASAASRKLLSAGSFGEISDWYYFALVELLDVKTYKTPAELAEALGISKTEADYALRKLEAADLIQRTPDGYRKTNDRYEMPSLSADAIRKFHRQTLERAARAVDQQEFDAKVLRGLTLSFDKNRVAEAEAEIAKFVKKFESKFALTKKNSVYQLNLALYRVDRSN